MDVISVMETSFTKLGTALAAAFACRRQSEHLVIHQAPGEPAFTLLLAASRLCLSASSR